MNIKAGKKPSTMILVGLMIVASILVFIPTEVSAIPSFGTPEIDPEYPNATEPVNITIEITDNQTITNAMLYYSYDGSTWTPVNMNITGGYILPTGGTPLGSSSTSIFGSSGLAFGIDNYGELFDGTSGFRYPSSVDHTTSGTELEGYTVVYNVSAFEYRNYAVHSSRSGINPGTIYIIENTATFFRGYVVTSTNDGRAQITNDFVFFKDTKYLIIYMTVKNVGTSVMEDLVLKRNVDWDMDGDTWNTFNWDVARSMGYAYQTRYGAVAGSVPTDYHDLDGWNDYRRRITDGYRTSGPITFDGLVTLHWELGDLVPGERATTIPVIYTAGDSLSEIRSSVDAATVYSGGAAKAYCMIPGPGYSTWVYYYVNATNQNGESSNSMIYSYYVDGTKPVVVDSTPVTGLISSEEKVTIFTNVTDDYYLGPVLLWYNNGTGWTNITMNFVSGNSTNASYKVDIPPARSQTTVDYYIQVFDRAKNSNSSTIKNFSTNSPPIIRDVKNIPAFPKGSSIVSVLANVTDTDGIFTVTLYYSTDGVTYTSTSMTSPGGNTYNGTIPPTGFTIDVYYYIKSTDNIGLSNTTPIFIYHADADPPWFDPPTIYPRYPNATDDVNVTIGIMDNAKVTNATLHYTYDGITWFNTPMIDFGVSGTFYENKVESGPLGWTHYALTGSAGDNWVISSWRSVSPINSWWGGQEPGSNWGDSCLESPLFTNLPSYTNLTFWHWYNFYTFPTDGCIVEINDGSGWSQIFPVNGYDATLNTGWQNPLEGKQAFTGGSGGWQQETFVLSAYAGKDVRIRFHVGWNIINDGWYEGWYIDDITLYSDVGGWSGIISGPGYSTWVNYYVVASDQAGNINNSVTYSYYIDGTHPVVLDTSDVISPVATYAQVSIFTNVTDDSGINFNDVYLWYDIGGGWTKVPMNFMSGNFTHATFRGIIPPSNIETTVYYYVEVVDNASNSNVSITKNYLTNAPPLIWGVNHQPQYPNGTCQVTVYANITDGDGIGSATLYYSTDGITYTSAPMSIFSGITYNGTIPPAGAVTIVYYYIRTTDTNGFESNSSVCSYPVDNQPPFISVPSINPPYPTVSDLVNVSFLITDNVDIGSATLYYSYDGVIWFTSPVYIIGASFGKALFYETFPTTSINTSNWASTVSSPLISTLAYNEPTPPYSLELDSTDDTITSVVIDLSNYFNVTINFSYEMGGGGNPPESSDWLYLDYYTSSGSWVNLWSQNGDGFSHNTFDEVGIALPPDAYHTNFRFRFRSWGSYGDDFYIDDIKLISHKNAYAYIPGPGCPSRVYYHINAVDKTGNSMDTNIYSYAVGPDLMLTKQNITFIPCPIENGTTVQINATIYNGGASLVGVEVRFYDGNPDIDNDNIIDTGAKEIGTPVIIDPQPNSIVFASTFWTPPKRDSYDVYVWVDAINATWEWDEWNNLASNKLVVYDWVDNFLDETRIEYKNDITVSNGDVTLKNVGSSISVTGFSYQWNVGGNWGSDYYAQSFIATDPFISSVGIYIGGDSFPYPDMRVQLWGDLSGNPDKNNIIASGDVILGSTITFTGQRYYINFSTPLPVTINDRYWVIIDGYYDHNTTGDCFAKRNNGNPYPDGVFKISNDVATSWWVPSFNYDLDFIVTFYKPVSNGNLRSVEITLPLGHVWETLFVNKTELSNTNIWVSVLNKTTNTPITGFSDLPENIIDMTSIDPELYPSIKLEAKFAGDGITSPVLHYWAINWVPSPKADAGPDDSVDEDTTYTFDGSGSWSSIGIASYAWDIDASDGLDWINPDKKGPDMWNPTYTYYTPGVYIVTLNVTDINGYWDNDTMILTVNDRTDPVADAGSDDLIDEDSPYTFDASGSWDNSGTIVSYLWDIDASDGVDLITPDYTGISPTHIFYEPGTYIVTLKVVDATGNWDINNTTIVVKDITPPFADAGLDASVIEDETYQFDGSRSNDNVGIIFYNWTFGDGSYQFGTNLTPIHTYSSEGRYVVALKVTDEAGNWNEDTITIFVNNLAPVADAGEDQIVYQGQVVTFDGGNSSDTPSDEPYLTYVWYFGDGFVGAGKVTTHTYTEPGVYTVTLIVTDNNGAISSDTLTVATKDATWPTANAGQDDYVDQNVPYQFDGRASTDDVGIVAYQWDIDSSDGIDWSSPDYEGAAPTHVYTEPGVYVVSLRVIDGDGNHDIDTLTITVKETPEKVKVPCAPTDVEVLLTPENDALNISWIAPTENEDGSPLTETDLDHYEIYYRIGENQKFQKLCDAPIGAISHIHSDLMTGIMYYYYLIAVDRDSTRSQPSITVGRMPSADTDGDQNPDITDEDDDNDGYPDVMEIIGGSDSKNALSKPADNDADLLPDYIDTDDDNDDHLDSEDDYPLDPTRWKKAEDGFVWLWIFIGLIIALLCIIALLGWKLYGVGEERPQEQHPKEKTPVKPKEDMKKKRVARRPPKKLKPPMAKSKPKGLAPPPPPPPSLPPPPPPPFSPLPTEEAAPQEEPKSAEESEEEVEFIIVEEQNVPEQPFTEEGITEGELPEAPTEEFEIEEKKSPSQSPKERPRKEEIPEPKIDEPETEE